jgi:hypothetical protein
MKPIVKELLNLSKITITGVISSVIAAILVDKINKRL